MVSALGGRGSEPELAMRPKVKPRQSIVREGETFLVSPSFFGENSQNPWRVSAHLTLERHAARVTYLPTGSTTWGIKRTAS